MFRHPPSCQAPRCHRAEIERNGREEAVREDRGVGVMLFWKKEKESLSPLGVTWGAFKNLTDKVLGKPRYEILEEVLLKGQHFYGSYMGIEGHKRVPGVIIARRISYENACWEYDLVSKWGEKATEINENSLSKPIPEGSPS